MDGSDFGDESGGLGKGACGSATASASLGPI